MKKYYFLVIGFAFFISCTNSHNSEVKTLYKGFSINDLTEIELKLYRVKEVLFPVLDTIINSVIECSNYKDRQIGFILTSQENSIAKPLISIENITKLHEFNYENCNGIFYYKGYQIVHSGIINDFILEDLKKEIKIFYVNSSKLKSIHNEDGEFFNSSWEYIFDNEQFNCISYKYCGNYWYDEKYR